MQVCVKVFDEELGPGKQRPLRRLEPATYPRDSQSRTRR
jgi:hypothetical protein